MTNPDNINPVMAGSEFSIADSPAINLFQQWEIKKPGPVRAYSISEASWARLESIQPYPESPIHD